MSLKQECRQSLSISTKVGKVFTIGRIEKLPEGEAPCVVR